MVRRLRVASLRDVDFDAVDLVDVGGAAADVPLEATRSGDEEPLLGGQFVEADAHFDAAVRHHAVVGAQHVVAGVPEVVYLHFRLRFGRAVEDDVLIVAPAKALAGVGNFEQLLFFVAVEDEGIARNDLAAFDEFEGGQVDMLGGGIHLAISLWALRF